MAELSDLEQRIKTALDRIRAGTETLTAAPTGPDPGDLANALDAQKAANQALQDQVDAATTAKDAAEAEAAQLQDALVAARQRSVALRLRVDELRETLRTLRAAGQDAISDPQLVNQAMKAELDGLRDLRDADRAELDALIAALEPLAGEERSHA